MNKIFCALVAFGVIAGVAAGLAMPAGAAEPRKHKRVKHSYVERSKKTRSEYPRVERQREHLADKLPFGSQIWWDQMLREDRVQN